jgi:hypothetical protein
MCSLCIPVDAEKFLETESQEGKGVGHTPTRIFEK